MFAFTMNFVGWLFTLYHASCLTNFIKEFYDDGDDVLQRRGGEQWRRKKKGREGIEEGKERKGRRLGKKEMIGGREEKGKGERKGDLYAWLYSQNPTFATDPD